MLRPRRDFSVAFFFQHTIQPHKKCGKGLLFSSSLDFTKTGWVVKNYKL